MTRHQRELKDFLAAKFPGAKITYETSGHHFRLILVRCGKKAAVPVHLGSKISEHRVFYNAAKQIRHQLGDL